MASERTMADETDASSSADYHDPDNDYHDAQMVLAEPNKHIDQPASSSTFHLFPLLPWEMRRLIWEFALPRNIFHSARLDSTTCVPNPTLSLVCHEASLVIKESGSMITAWDTTKIHSLVLRRFLLASDETNFYIQTWFSPKLDTIILDPIDLNILDLAGEAARCDLINICRSPTTSLMLDADDFSYRSPTIHQTYNGYIENRETVLLRIAEHRLILKDEAWDIIMAPQKLGAIRNATDLIHLDDTAALVKYLKLWEHCCKEERTSFLAGEHCDFGSWIEMAIDEEKRARTRGYMKTYKAWMVEDEAFVEHIVTPEAWFFLRLADRIMSDHGVHPEYGRGHEIMDYTGKLKEGHPLLRELDIKLPEVIPVCTVEVLRRCSCEDGQTQGMREIERDE